MIYQSHDIWFGFLLVAVALFGAWHLLKAVYHAGFKRGFDQGALIAGKLIVDNLGRDAMVDLIAKERSKRVPEQDTRSAD